ncbi:hypothetical protein FSP39_002812 [Pinctada imbricata]|uniref:Cadherin domain-containing protein n=1 Tax=Pinctada imbricata TaxID=66713 RepID=A0AA89BYM0_PINIB|nr:hypothetical protein FSP39_002812 [Pinctada imbricata]
MDEENDQDHILGNVSQDANLRDLLGPADNLTDLRYTILTTGNQVASLFTIDGKTSTLSTNQVLDRDTLCQYDPVCILKFDVVAKSEVTDFFHKITVSVTLKDINDNTPEFPDPVVEVPLAENSVIGTETPLAGAIDLDSGNNSVQAYRIFPESVPFIINEEFYPDGRSTLRLVVSRKLDRETEDRYRFKILALDRGNPVKTGSVIIDVNVLDINDNPPNFEKDVYNISIAEDFPLNTMILRVKALDSDIGENGEVFYRLSQRQNDEIRRIFYIHPTSGELSLMTSLITESRPTYTVIVEASDNASAPLISQAQILVTVLDTHNAQPAIKTTLFFTQDNSNFIHIVENVKNGTVIASISAVDPDKGLNGQVDCVSNDSDFRLWKVETNGYTLAVFGKLNRELSEKHNIKIQCTDKGAPPKSAFEIITVILTDVNDNAPKFTQDVYRIEKPENELPNSSIFQVIANDSDVTPTSITYFISNTSDAVENFYVDSSSGIVYNKRPLDRELSSFISIPVVARDNKPPFHIGSAILEVIVLDVNDNAPYFLHDKYNFSLLENQPTNTFVGKVFAEDKDEGKNAEVTISAQNINDLPFRIFSNGSIFTTRPLDREASAQYTISVVARDRGSPALSNVTNVTVSVLDVNDNSPKIHVQEVLRISQFTPANTQFFVINATDDDFETNSQLMYDIEDQSNVSKIISINKLQGQLRLVRSLTSDDVGQYKCVVIVTDMGNSPRTSSASFTIFVTRDDISTQKYTSEAAIKYYAIAVAICCVTIVLSSVIILVICLIRRKDRLEGDKTNSSITSQVTQDSDLSQMDMRINDTYSTDYVPGTLMKSFSGGKKKEKQVTFKSPYIAPHVKFEEEDSDETPPEVISEDVTIWDWNQPYTHAYRSLDQYSPDEPPNIYGMDQKNYMGPNVLKYNKPIKQPEARVNDA